MELNLPFPPTPENAPKFAEKCVEAVKRSFDIDLDYSERSLELIDSKLGDFHVSGNTSDEMGATAFVFGAYIGEVMVRHAGGEWVDTTTDETVPEFMRFPMSVQVRSRYTVPFAKACKRIDNGEEDDIVFYYQVITSEAVDRIPDLQPPRPRPGFFGRLFGRR